MTTTLSPTIRIFANTMAYEFFNNLSNFEKVRNEFASGDKFRNFAGTLGFPCSQIETYIQYGPFECCAKAFTKWLNAGHSMMEFVKVLVEVKHKLLARKLDDRVLVIFDFLQSNPDSIPGSIAVPSCELQVDHQDQQKISMNPDPRDPPISHGSVNPGASKISKIAAACKKSELSKDVTCQAFFVAEDGVHAAAKRKLISALDDTGLWELVLADRGILNDNQVAAEVVQRKRAWEEDEISPTKLMIEDLLQTSFASEKMLDFASYLIGKGNPQIGEIMKAWVQKVQGKIENAQKAGANQFEKARDLHEFFMSLVDEDSIFTSAMIPDIVAKLQKDDISTIKLLGRLRDEEFSSYGITTGQRFVLRDALEQLKKSS